MRSRFIHFTSDYKYVRNNKCWCSADQLLEAWLNEHTKAYVKSWQAMPTGKENQLTIVVEYLEDDD